MQSEKTEQIIALIKSKILGGKVLSVQFSDKYNPHFAKVLIQNFQKKLVAVVIGLLDDPPENILTYSLLWFYQLNKLKTKRAEKLWIISNQGLKLAKLCSTLHKEWQNKIRLFDSELVEQFDNFSETKKIKLTKPFKLNELVNKIISLAPENVQIKDKVLSFNGLPFAKFDSEKVWFGIENQKQTLDETNWDELTELIENLKIYRQTNSPNKHHIFYKLFPEAWLEAKLKNDISKLDENLILSPLHNQFRASSEQIDLLALRKDGRLVIIELKVSPNREHLFQALDYWQEIEKQRLAGNLRGLFGEFEIVDAPSLIYLVAPHSCFHQDFNLLAQTVSEKLEISRFDLNENWREIIKVVEKRLIK